MSKKIALQILDHPNKDEILSKLIIGNSCSDIHEWLDEKYGSLGKRALVISAVGLSNFKDNYLEFTVRLRDDLTKTQEKLRDPSVEVNLALTDNKDYEKGLVKHLEKEIDIKSKMINLLQIAEDRINHIYTMVQQNPTSFKGDRYIIDYFTQIGAFLEKYHKIVLAVPENSVQHNVTINVVDQHASHIQNAIKKTLMAMDTETSLKFIEIFTQEINSLQEKKEGFLPLEERYIEAQLIEESFKK